MKQIRNSIIRIIPIIVISGMVSALLLSVPAAVYGAACSPCSAKIVFTGAERSTITLLGSFDGGSNYEPFTSMFQDGNTEYYNLSGPIIFRATNGTETIQKDSITFVAYSGETGGQVTVTFTFSASTGRVTSYHSFREQRAREYIQSTTPSPLSLAVAESGLPPSFLLPNQDFTETATEVAIVVRRSPTDSTIQYLQADGTPATHPEWRAWSKWGYDTTPPDPLHRRIFLSEDVKPATYILTKKFRTSSTNETTESAALTIRADQFPATP